MENETPLVLMESPHPNGIEALVPSIAEMRSLYRADLSSFIQFVFATLYPNKPYRHNWHIDVMADQLMRCTRGECRRLIINLPPRMLKSTCASIAYPAWVLVNDPSAQVMCISYGEELVKDFGLATRTVMTSRRFKGWFPDVTVSSRRHTATHLNLVTGGVRQGVSAGGAITGRGADMIIIDDPLKASDINTKERSHINQWFDENIYQRLNNKNTGVIILVMQRLHEDDLTAHLVAQSDEWEVIELKAIAEENESYCLSDGTCYQRQIGDALHPQMESVSQLLRVKQNLGGYVFASQYQQDPAADGESLIRSDWFGQFDPSWLVFHDPAPNPPRVPPYGPNAMITHTVRPPPNPARLTAARRAHFRRLGFTLILQSWDTAQTIHEKSDYTVCVTVGIKSDQYYVLDVLRKKLRFQEIMDAVIDQQIQFGADKVIVEDAPAGHYVIEALRDRYVPIKANRPVGDKYTRLSAISGYVESGLVHLPQNAPWRDDFLLEITRFPNVRHDDQVDAFSQAMQVAQDRSDLYAMAALCSINLGGINGLG